MELAKNRRRLHIKKPPHFRLSEFTTAHQRAMSVGGDCMGRILMKSTLAFLALVMACLWGRAASADTITTGDLSFTCNICGVLQNGNQINTAPTGGSFAYDNTTNQFLSLLITWDGVTFTFIGGQPSINDPGNAEAVYLALIGSAPVYWDGICLHLPNDPFPCEEAEGFRLDGFFGSYVSGAFPFINDETGGLVTATNPVTTTPEPPVIGLLLMGIGFVLALKRRTISAPSEPLCSRSVTLAEG
jgi:hypothetical protein